MLSHSTRALLLVLTLASAGTAEDWPGWRGPRGDGTWNGPQLQDAWPRAGLRTRWKTAIGAGYAGVTVVGERVYVMDRRTEPAEIERVVCFAAETGKPLWMHSYAVKYGDLDHGTGPRAAVTFAEDRLYCLGSLGHLHCLDVRTGEVLWKKRLVDDLGGRLPQWGFSASPVLFENRLYVQPGGANGAAAMALDPRTGAEVWRSLSDKAGYGTPIVIAHRKRHQLVWWTPSHIRGLDPADGKPLWNIPYEVTYGVSIATPIFQDGIVFVAGYWHGSRAIRLGERRTDAELAWKDTKLLRGLMSQPLYRDGYVYLLDKGRGLTCFELSTGKKLWDDGNRMTPRGRNPQASLVWTGHEDRALVLNSEGELILARLNPQGYDERARTKIIESTWAHPAYAGRYVFARSDTELVCVELPVAEK